MYRSYVDAYKIYEVGGKVHCVCLRWRNIPQFGAAALKAVFPEMRS